MTGHIVVSRCPLYLFFPATYLGCTVKATETCAVKIACLVGDLAEIVIPGLDSCRIQLASIVRETFSCWGYAA